MTVINTNVASLNAQAALASNARGLNKAMEQLSTGKRINSAADDAAGLAISTRLTSQIRGLNQAVRNANDGISLVQIGEGALVEVTNMMQRMRELSVQSANDTNTDGDRQSLSLEFKQLKEEINRIGKTVEWNGTKILDGSFGADSSGKFTFQVGANANQTIDLTIKNMTSSDATTIDDSNVTAGTQLVDMSSETFEEGDIITLAIDGKQAQYTVTADDMAGASAAVDFQNVLDSIAGDTSISDALGVTIAATAATGLTFTSDDGADFSVDAYKATGALGFIAASDVDTQNNANRAIGAIDKALGAVNDQRANMGAVINRLQYTVNNLTNISTHSAEARSRIEDTNYAQSTMDLAKSQIIQQAATAMLAQANQQPQQVLTLLK